VRRRWEVDRESWLEKEIPQDQHSQVIQSGVSRREKGQDHGTFLLERMDKKQEHMPGKKEEKKKLVGNYTS
jgi:hypothetical protein